MNLEVLESSVPVRARVADYARLAKPELTLLSVMTALGGAFLASQGSVPYFGMLHTFVGTLLVGGGAGTLNQIVERKDDALMKRTEHRPLPAGRLSYRQAAAYGAVLSTLGVVYLALSTNVLAAFLAVATLVTYVALYTPLKKITPFATVIGGIPGALPPMIGWAVVRGEITIEAYALFAIIFFWQMPHFLSLAWVYRRDYARAGYRTLTVIDRDGSATGRQILFYSIALLPATVLPTYVGLTGVTFFIGGFIVAIAFLSVALRFFSAHTAVNARRIFYASLCYLPLLALLIVLDRMLR